jgi:Tol biopolymer transport system component
MIAYAARQPAGRQVVHIASVDGTEIRRLARTGSTGDAFGPQWSPDGGQIVYQSTHGLNDVGALSLVDVATAKRRS